MSGKTLQNQPARPESIISKHPTEKFIGMCVGPLPHKAFSLIGGDDLYHPYRKAWNPLSDAGNGLLFDTLR